MNSSLFSHLIKSGVKFYTAVIGNKKFNQTPLAVLVLFTNNKLLL